MSKMSDSSIDINFENSDALACKLNLALTLQDSFLTWILVSRFPLDFSLLHLLDWHVSCKRQFLDITTLSSKCLDYLVDVNLL